MRLWQVLVWRCVVLLLIDIILFFKILKRFKLLFIVSVLKCLRWMEKSCAVIFFPAVHLIRWFLNFSVFKLILRWMRVIVVFLFLFFLWFDFWEIRRKLLNLVQLWIKMLFVVLDSKCLRWIRKALCWILVFKIWSGFLTLTVVFAFDLSTSFCRYYEYCLWTALMHLNLWSLAVFPFM